MKVTLLSYENRNESVSTRWGAVQFDGKGFAELEVSSEDDLARLRALKWLVESTVEPMPVPEITGTVEEAPAPPAEATTITPVDTTEPALPGLPPTKKKR